MKTKNLTIIFSALLIGITAASFRYIQQAKPWAVPEKNAKMANPVKANTESINAGKALWSKNCQSCHGKKGVGDGTKAPDLKTPPADLTKADIQSQSDGSLFYKISEGRDDMPRFKKDIPDPEDIWNVVNYLRTLKAK